MAYRRWPGDDRGGGSGWDASEWAFHNALEALRQQHHRAAEINRRTSRRVLRPILLIAVAMLAISLSGIDVPETALTCLLVVIFVSSLSATCVLPGLVLEARLKDVDLTEFFRTDPATGLSAVIQRLTEEAEAFQEPNERTIRQIRILSIATVTGAVVSISLFLVGVILLIVL